MKKITVLAIVLTVAFTVGMAMAAKKVEWASYNSEPLLADAKFVNDRADCLECHKEYIEVYDKTKHAKVFKSRGEGDCETCHGPASKHLDKYLKGLPELQNVESPLIFSFSFKSKSVPSKKKSDVCLQCHEGGIKMYWKSGLHQASGVSCDSCHYVMERRSDKSLFANEDVKTLCYKCHPDKKGQNLKASHMPVREGKMDCSNCHNPHGSAGQKMLKTATVNETCYSCHAEKRGPFIWEHAAVRENCSNCHDPHGSNNPGLLNTKGPFLCLKCHQYGGHVNLPRYNRASTPYGQGCINCHTRIHGSNHPSGAKLTR